MRKTTRGLEPILRGTKDNSTTLAAYCPNCLEPIRFYHQSSCSRCDAVFRWPEEDEGSKTIGKQLEEIAEDICRNYCKWPDLWDEEKEGCELADSDHCKNCPLNRL